MVGPQGETQIQIPEDKDQSRQVDGLTHLRKLMNQIDKLFTFLFLFFCRDICKLMNTDIIISLSVGEISGNLKHFYLRKSSFKI